MVTLKLKYTTEENNLSIIRDYVRQYNSVYRVVFNALQKGVVLSQKYIQENINNIGLLDSWLIQSAISDAKVLFSKTKDDKIIFGGKKNFIKRCLHKISKEEFNKSRLVPLYCSGEKDSGTKHVHGNRKFRLTEDLSYATFKTSNGKLELKLPKKLKQNIKKQLIQIYRFQVEGSTPISYKIDENYIYIIVDESVVFNSNLNPHFIENRVLALDLNPNYIGWSIVDWKSEGEFNVVKSGIYSIKELNDFDFSLKGLGLSSESDGRKQVASKRKHETIEIVKNIVNTAIYYKCQLISCEDLNIKSSNVGRGKKYNKLVSNSWCRNLFVNNLQKRCNILNIKLLKVKPEYSSFIGNFLYRELNLPDMVLASIEIGRRGYEFYNQYINKTKEIKKNIVLPDLNIFKKLYLKSLEEFQLQPVYKDLIELYYFIKKSKMMYRLSIDQFNPQFSRLFSRKSYINYVTFCVSKRMI